MATNYIQPGEVVEVASASTNAGDPVVVGTLPGVALTDTNDSGNIQLATEGVFELSVTGADNSGNAAMNAGDKVYMDSGTLNADATDGSLFGKLLEGVSSGATESVPVRIVQA